MQGKSERIELRVDSGLVERLDEWRRGQADVPARSEAIRRLLDLALSSNTALAQFQIMRFQILSAGLMQPGPGDRLQDEYLFAWQHGVYPIYHDDALVAPFEPYFEVGREMISRLVRFLDRDWLNGKTYTFYELEDHYKVRSGGSEWDRHKLVSALTYVYMTRNFDDSFWGKMLEQFQHPSEAGAIIHPFNRPTSIYFL